MLRIRLRSFLLLAPAALSLTACQDAPEYSIEPSIEYKSSTVTRVNPTDGSTPANFVTVTIKYKDGDGDLGLSDADKQTAPFNDTGSEYRFNFHIKMYYFNTVDNRFEPYIYPNPSFTFDGTFSPRMLGENDKPQPIRGDLSYSINKGSGFPITTPQFRPGGRLKFDIYIYDRALHKSNVITTDEITLQ